jgi:hypothetical protein
MLRCSHGNRAGDHRLITKEFLEYYVVERWRKLGRLETFTLIAISPGEMVRFISQNSAYWRVWHVERICFCFTCKRKP